MTKDSNQITREYFDSLLLEMRHIDSDIPSTEVEIFGESFSTPIMTAALSHLHNICDNAMTESQREHMVQVLCTGSEWARMMRWKKSLLLQGPSV